MAGAAKWCLNQAAEAVSEWRTALTATYTGVPRGLSSALLIYFAATLKPNVVSEAEAVDLLTRCLEKKSPDQWPTPIALFLLEEIGESELYQMGTKERESVTILNHHDADFYVGIRERKQGNEVRYLEFMAKVATIGDEEFDVRCLYFLRKLWGPQFFLARHEIGAVLRHVPTTATK